MLYEMAQNFRDIVAIISNDLNTSLRFKTDGQIYREARYHKHWEDRRTDTQKEMQGIMYTRTDEADRHINSEARYHIHRTDGRTHREAMHHIHWTDGLTHKKRCKVSCIPTQRKQIDTYTARQGIIYTGQMDGHREAGYDLYLYRGQTDGCRGQTDGHREAGYDIYLYRGQTDGCTGR